MYDDTWAPRRPSSQESACQAADASSGVQSLGWEDPLEEEMATHSSVLPWEVSRTEEPNGLQSMGSKQSDTTDRVNNSKQQMIIIASYRGVPLP